VPALFVFLIRTSLTNLLIFHMLDFGVACLWVAWTSVAFRAGTSTSCVSGHCLKNRLHGLRGGFITRTTPSSLSARTLIALFLAFGPAQAFRPLYPRVYRPMATKRIAMSSIEQSNQKWPNPCPNSSVALRGLFDGEIDPDVVAAGCSEDVVWNDMSRSGTVKGRDAVRDLLAAKFPKGSGLKIERISDGHFSGGFTWSREADGFKGLRGTLYAEFDQTGKITYIQEGCEPLFKPGEATEKFLKAVTSFVDKPEREPNYIPASPKSASDIVNYLWEEAYPGGAGPEAALKLFADDIVYEDFNYPEPFVGKAAVREFVTAFDIPGIQFVPLRVSDGKRGCAFTWKVMINGQDGPSGISFYEVNDKGEISYIRDIPAPSMPFGMPPPLASLAAAINPKLRIF